MSRTLIDLSSYRGSECQKWFTISFIRRDLPSDETCNVILISSFLHIVISNTSSCTLIIISVHINVNHQPGIWIDHSRKNLMQVTFSLRATFEKKCKKYTQCVQPYNNIFCFVLVIKNIINTLRVKHSC